MNEEIFHIIEYLHKEKEIPKEVLIEAVESALSSAVRKTLGKKTETVYVKLDQESGQIKVFDEEEEIKLPDFGRIAAQTAKQVMMQKIKEAERNVIYDSFTEKIGAITNGIVHRIEKGNVIVDLGKSEAVLFRNHMLPKEIFKVGDRVRAVIFEVNRTSKGPQIILSRTCDDFVKQLFELEVPEIYEDIVQIKSIAREPGQRTKLAVYSSDEKIDSVGACVGMRGARVKNIVKELRGEKIDIIRWNPDIIKFTEAALSPAEVVEITEDKDTQKIRIIVEDNQLSLAIGKRGQNVRLASKLIGREVEIKSQSELISEVKIPITEIAGIGQKTREILIEAGYDDVTAIAKAPEEDLMALKGIGKKTVQTIVEGAKEVLKDRGIEIIHIEEEVIDEEVETVEEESVEEQSTDEVENEEDVEEEEQSAAQEEETDKETAQEPEEAEEEEETENPTEDEEDEKAKE